MKIYITGSTGFLGKSIVELLPQHNYYKYKRGESVIDTLNNLKPDIIIHSAGEIYNESQMYVSNIKLTESILDWVKVNDVKMIYFGSSSEYGIVNKPMNESMECIPVTYYAASKLWGTQKCIQTSIDYNKDICVVRPFSVYGKNEPERRLIPTLRKKLIDKTDISLIKGDHDFIYIKDFVRCIELIIDSTKTKGEIFNVGSGISYSNADILNIMLKIINPSVASVKFLNDIKQCDSQTWICDTTKSYNILNFKCEYTVESGLKEFIYDYEN